MWCERQGDPKGAKEPRRQGILWEGLWYGSSYSGKRLGTVGTNVKGEKMKKAWCKDECQFMSSRVYKSVESRMSQYLYASGFSLEIYKIGNPRFISPCFCVRFLVHRVGPHSYNCSVRIENDGQWRCTGRWWYWRECLMPRVLMPRVRREVKRVLAPLVLPVSYKL